MHCAKAETVFFSVCFESLLSPLSRARSPFVNRFVRTADFAILCKFLPLAFNIEIAVFYVYAKWSLFLPSSNWIGKLHPKTHGLFVRTLGTRIVQLKSSCGITFGCKITHTSIWVLFVLILLFYLGLIFIPYFGKHSGLILKGPKADAQF